VLDYLICDDADIWYEDIIPNNLTDVDTSILKELNEISLDNTLNNLLYYIDNYSLDSEVDYYQLKDELKELLKLFKLDNIDLDLIFNKNVENFIYNLKQEIYKININDQIENDLYNNYTQLKSNVIYYYNNKLFELFEKMDIIFDYIQNYINDLTDKSFCIIYLTIVLYLLMIYRNNYLKAIRIKFYKSIVRYLIDTDYLPNKFYMIEFISNNFISQNYFSDIKSTIKELPINYNTYKHMSIFTKVTIIFYKFKNYSIIFIS
jgi:hypothetical protein